MTIEDLKERGLQLLALVPLSLLVAALTCPATDLEPPWGDGATPPQPDHGTAAADADEDPAGDGPDAADPDAPPPGPPTLVGTRCLAPEIPAGGVCLVIGPRSATVRYKTDRDAFGRIACRAAAGEVAAEASAASAEHRLVVAPLEPRVPHDCSVVARTAAGETALSAFGLETAGGGPWVAITEVLADPAGPEPAQEFVEVANLDDVEVDLGGWALDDEGGGAVVPAGTVLAPGDVVLLVPDAYDPDGAGDPPADPAAALVRLGRSLGASGLRNSGEAVFLIDPEGLVVSSCAATPGGLGNGVSAERLPPTSPESDGRGWTVSGSGGPTPGRIDR